VNPKTGEVFWKRPFNGRNGLTSSPVAAGYRVYLCAGHGPNFSECLQMFVEDGKIKARLAYHKENVQWNSHNTPAVIDGCVYGFGSGNLQCTKIEDGSILWQQQWNTDRHLIAADGLLFIATNKGDLVLAEANKTGYKELGRVATGINLDGNTQQMTIANGRLYQHGDKFIVCYDVMNPNE